MKVITPRSTPVYMGPLGIGPLIWDAVKPQLNKSWLLERPVTRAVCKEQAKYYPDTCVNPCSERYYRAIDIVSAGDCVRMPDDMFAAEWYNGHLKAAKFPPL